MFQVPRSAGGHPRLVIGLLFVLVLGGAVFFVLPRPSAEPVVVAPAPRPPVKVVLDLPQLAGRLEREAAAGRFNGAVLVARGDRVLFRQVYGMADHEAGQPLGLESRFRLASVSKQFTAVAILKLQDEEVLSVEDPLCRWIQPCPEAWAPIRLKHLLSHTSGVPDLMSQAEWGRRRVTPTRLADLTAASAMYRLQFEPGAKVRYDNAGFNLLADVVERASGKTLDAYLHAAIFEPLGMADTGLDDGGAHGIVMGYANLAGGLTRQPQANPSVITGAGALYSTLDDLLAWQRALHHGGVISDASYADMIADHAPADTPDERRGPRRDWGYGIFVNSLGGRVRPGFYERQIYHTGSWSGFRNLVTYQPEADIVVIVLSNNFHQMQPVFLISQQAMAEALGKPFPTEMAP